MGGRNTYATGKDVPFTYRTVGFFQGVKILEGIDGHLHKLPEEAHSSDAYARLFPDGNLHQLRFYDGGKHLVAEIEYHPKPELTGHHNHVYHIHFYDVGFRRSPGRLLTADEIVKYQKFFTVKGHFQ